MKQRTVVGDGAVEHLPDRQERPGEHKVTQAAISKIKRATLSVELVHEPGEPASHVRRPGSIFGWMGQLPHFERRARDGGVCRRLRGRQNRAPGGNVARLRQAMVEQCHKLGR
jgi:hypothetical protein